jgi:hypothetical protein
MKNKHFVPLAIGIAIAGTLLGASFALSMETTSAQASETTATTTPALLTHQQLVWSYALEDCESAGNESAINPRDLDGTPSYYSFQFKPSTFLGFGIHYGILATGTTPAQLKVAMRDYPTERKLVEAMVHDGKNINWHRQFPDCVRKLGMPPVSP